MSVQKGKNSEVQDFKFGQLRPTESVDGVISDFELKALDPDADFNKIASPEEIRVEREHEWNSGFEIQKDVREHRGIKEQENQDFEDRVEEEVKLRLSKREKRAYEEGFRSGQNDGEKKSYDESVTIYENKILAFEDFLLKLMEEKKGILDESKTEIYSLVNKLTKWIILKETNDKAYVERLLEKLVLEINTKSNLLIKVSEQDLEAMPEIIKSVESRLGALSNIRVEVGVKQRGIVLESEVGIVDGSFESQMKSLDKLFENVGLKTEESYE